MCADPVIIHLSSFLLLFGVFFLPRNNFNVIFMSLKRGGRVGCLGCCAIWTFLEIESVGNFYLAILGVRPVHKSQHNSLNTVFIICELIKMLFFRNPITISCGSVCCYVEQ